MRGDYQRAPQLTLLYNAMRAPLLRPCFGLGHTLHCAHNQGSGVVLVGCFLQWPFLHGSRRARWRSCPRSDMSLPSPRPLRAFPATAASLHKCTRCKGLQAPVSLPVHSHGLAAMGFTPARRKSDSRSLQCLQQGGHAHIPQGFSLLRIHSRWAVVLLAAAAARLAPACANALASLSSRPPRVQYHAASV